MRPLSVASQAAPAGDVVADPAPAHPLHVLTTAPGGAALHSTSPHGNVVRKSTGQRKAGRVKAAGRP